MGDEFFPKDYSIPSSGGVFTKLEKGENHFRILDKVTMGFEYWTDDKKPVRSYDEFKEMLPNAAKDKDGKVIKPKHIWVFPIWDCKNKRVAILNVGQKGVQENILSLSHDSDWGSPLNYDIRIIAEGDGFDRTYTVSPKPKAEVPAEVMAQYEKSKEDIIKAIEDMFKPSF